MTYVLIVWKFIRAHWHIVAIFAALLGSLGGSYGLGHRSGYRAGFHAGASLNPQVTLKEECHAEVIAPKCEAAPATVTVRYVHVPGEPPSCPPTPEVSITGGGSSASSGGATARNDLSVTPSIPDYVGGSGGSPRGKDDSGRWTASGLVGIGGSGLEVGAVVQYRLVGPVELGGYVRVPTHDVPHSSAGVTLGFRF